VSIVTIATIETNDIPAVAELARVIWFEHYPSIISWSQIHYMLERGYASSVIAAELARGVEWRLASDGGRSFGFASWERYGDVVKLHKLYVERAARGRGVGRQLVEVATLDARHSGAREMVLAVNKRNYASIRAYLGLGFSFQRAVCDEIGHGFVMDDYVMVLRV
jgi:diamine N-acetyltransferase